MVYLERGFASVGFEAGAGIDGPALARLLEGFETDGLEGVTRKLMDYYIQFGLASGRAGARELVRKVQAAGEAQVLGGRPRDC